MTADGTGLVVVNNPRRNESLIMSMADPTLLKSEGPVRFLQSCRAKDLVPGADIHPEDIARQMQLTGSTGGIWSFDPSRVKYVSLLWDACSDFEGLSVELEDVRTGAWRSASPFRVFTDDYVAPRYRTRTDIIVHEGDSVGGDRFDAIRVQYATSLGPDGDFCVLEDVDVFEYCPHPDPENGKGDCDGDHVLDEHDLCLNVRVDPLSTLGQDAFDSDGDGVADGLGWMGIDMGYGTLCDVCPAKPNPEQREVWERDTFGGDLDSDNIPDSCDLCPHLPGPFAWQAGMDDDGDGVACDCDNCTGANNPDQANCDEDLDPGDPGLYSSDVAGDACDPDPCIALLPSSVPEPAKVCNSGGYTYELLSVTETIDPVLVGFEPGEGDGARTEDVTHAFCNCTGYSTPEDCQSLYGGDCSEEPHPELDHDNIGPGWHYLNLDESMTFVPPATRGTVPRSFRKSGVSGSESSHPLDGTRNQTFVWDLLDDPEYAEGCSMYDCDDFDVYLYFHPKVDGFVTHETFHPSRPSEGWWRELGRKVCPYLHNPRIAEAEDARRGGGFYAHFDDASVPGETGDLLQGLGVFIPFWEYTDPAPAGRQNPFIRTSSLVTASATLLFDPAQGSFARVLGHVYDDVEDVLDARGGAAVMVGFAQLPGTDDLVVDGSADMATSRTIWLFGGEDRVQYRSDLWAGAVVATGDPDGDRVVWTRLLPQTGQAWPSPRAQSAMFHDPTTNSLVLWGGHDGQMVYDDLWYLDLDDMTWQEVVPQGWPPEGLVAMAYDHATLRSGQKGQVWPVPTGFIWGGMRADGTYSSDLFVLDLAHASFRRVLAGEDGPPGLMAAGLGVDRAGRTVYLSGGYDDITTHNWLWAMDLDRARWSLLQSDCLAGTCPYFSTGPAAVVDARTSLVSVIPGRSSVETVGVFAEPAFVHHHAGGWKGSHEWSGSGAAGDCDADGIPEEGAGLLCTSHPEWWNGPGTSLCDTLSGVLACDQAGTPASELGSRTVPGLGRMAVAGRTMFMLVADRLVSVDVSDALLPAALDSLYLGGKGRDLEIVSGDRIVVAADSGLVFVDVDQAGTMTRAARIPTCGRAVSVDVSGDDVYFLTPLGVGRAPLSGDPAVPELFSLVLPVSRWDFDLVPVDPGRCWVMSAIADAACRWFECPADGYRPLEAVGGALYFSALRHLMVVDASADVLELVADVGLDARVDEMRRHGTLIYANACDGGTEVIDVSASVSPVLLGEHSVAGWVDGLWASGESWFRQSGDVIEVAIEVQP